MDLFVDLDVSEMVPPDPLFAILEALNTLPDDHCLRVQHRREPFPLYEQLNNLGYAYLSRVLQPDLVRIYIWNRDRTDMKARCQQDLDHAP